MVKVTFRNNVKSETKIISEDTTLRQALEEAGIDYTRGFVSLDGVTLGVGDLDKSFAQHGITERCYLMQVVKADNA